MKNKILLVLIVILAVIVVTNQYIIMTSATITGAATRKEAQNTYGIPFSEEGYQQLLGYDKTIRLTDPQMKNYVGLDVEMECCGFKTLQAKGNCQCGHHIALSGLAKYLISKGYTREQVQSEINTWKNVFFGDSGGDMGGC